MLVMFKARNYASFNDEVMLDLRATSYKQHPSHLLDWDEASLLKTIAIYGANASGKSNLISAMFLFEQYIFNQFITKNDEELFVYSPFIKMEPFRLSDEVDEFSEFEIIFVHNDKTIQYGFEGNTKTVKSEWYYINGDKVFEREDEDLSFGKKYSKYIKSYKKVVKERLYLSVLEYFLDDQEKAHVLYDFVDFFNNKYNVFFEFFFESSIKNIFGRFRQKDKLIDDEVFRRKVVKYLTQIDVGIKDLIIKEKDVIDPDSGEEKKAKIIKTIHEIVNDEGQVLDKVEFDLAMESTGTLRFLSYIQEVIEMTERGGVFIVDEITARLHPLLTKLIIDIFQSSGNIKAQLIFTTHDISILNKDQFRRDEVVFVDKNNRGESMLFALSDLKVREDATFNKDYLNGKYGAIPIFDYDEIFSGDQIG